MAELISPNAKNFLCVLYNKSLYDFSIVDDASLMHLLEAHLQVLDTNDYAAKLKLVYMASTDHVRPRGDKKHPIIFSILLDHFGQ